MPMMSSALLIVPLREVHRRLSTRIIFLSMIALAVVLAMVSGTLWLSWQLEGAAAAINDAGSLRMRASRVAIELLLAQNGQEHQLAAQIIRMEQTLERLRKGNPARPLFLPDEPEIRDQFDKVSQDWLLNMKPVALRKIADDAPASTYLAMLPGFIEEANELVLMIERDNEAKTRLLRLSQFGVAIIASLGTVTVIYLLFLWIIRPVLRLQDGLRRMAAREFSLRLPVEGRDELGTLAEGFNRMASELQEVYRDLEARVSQKTAEVARRNRELEALYDMTAFLNLPGDAEAICNGFVQRVMQQFDADGGSVRLLDSQHDKLHLLAADGLSDELIAAERCQDVGECFSGKATKGASIVIDDLRHLYRMAPPKTGCYRCIGEGFSSIAVIPIETQSGVLGSFSLHFREQRSLATTDRQLLETLGQHLGITLEHLRLSATARQLAVVQERTLVAQGLHDSIAQALNFMNLQIQLLDDAVTRNDLEETREIVPLLRCGIEESYQDVRELLHNFRAKLRHGDDIRQAIEETVARFQRQCNTALQLAIRDSRDAPPLGPEQQLQVLFILQEALSNVRKHAHATNVAVTVEIGRDFRLIVEDDGEGFESVIVAQHSETHVGLHIMRERAMRLAAQLSITTRPGTGVKVELVLPRADELRPHLAAKRVTE